jgi:tetratricopeptide (TPR) repeat protein
MDATDLKIDDNSVEQIEMIQVIEHLGLIRGKYALSECFRVLKPNCKIIIETPDLRISFKKFLEGDRETRKYIMPWIFGVDIPGMQHRFCFPEDLLEDILKQIGFTNIKTQNLIFDEHQPILRVESEKPKEYKAHQIITHLRRNIVKNNLIDLDDQINAMEKENLINFFTSTLEKYYKNNDENILRELIYEGTVNSPILTYHLIKEIPDQEVKNKFLIKLEKIIDIDFPNILLQLLIETDGYIGEQEKLFSDIYLLGKKTVEKKFSTDEGNYEQTIQNIRKNNFLSSETGLDLFSNKLIMLKSNRIFQLGVKEFNLENYEKAIDFFKESVKLFRNQLLAYWNLGRLYYLQNNIEQGKKCYNNTLKILNKIDIRNKTKSISMIENEIKDYKQNMKEPVLSLEQL